MSFLELAGVLLSQSTRFDEGPVSETQGKCSHSHKARAATSLAETKQVCVRDVIMRNINSILVSRFAAVAGVAYQFASGTFSLWCKPQKCFPCEHTL